MPNELTLDQYQTQSRLTAIYPEQVQVLYPALGLAGEVGEVAEKLLQALFPADRPARGSTEHAIYFALSQAASAGRNCEVMKKVLRDARDQVPAEELSRLRARVEAMTGEQDVGLLKELGDSLWYESQLANDLFTPLSKVAQDNLDKLASRKARGVLQGSGDNR